MRTTPLPLRTLRVAVAEFATAGPDTSWQTLLGATAPAIDLSRPAHQQAALRWLNAWGCRIRYPRPGEPDVAGAGLGRWWAQWSAALPAAGVTLAELADPAIDALGPAYAALVATPVSAPPRARGLGPTAATKLLYALRPAALAVSLGQPDRTLAKMLDDYCYLAYTRGTVPAGDPQ
jgi:hypothetical protein